MRRDRARPGWLLNIIAALQVEHPRISWMFAETRQLAEDWAYRWLAAAFRLDRAHGRWWYVASGVVALILAALLIAVPGIGLLTLTWMVAFQALLAGSLLLGLAFRLRMRSAAAAAGEGSVPKRQPDDEIQAA